MTLTFPWTQSDLRDAAMYCHFKKMDPRHVAKRFHQVPTRKIKDILLRVDHGIKTKLLIDDKDSHSIHRFICKICQIPIDSGYAYTDYEVRCCLLDMFTAERTLKDCHIKYGTNDTVICRHILQFLTFVPENTSKEVKLAHKTGEYLSNSGSHRSTSGKIKYYMIPEKVST